MVVLITAIIVAGVTFAFGVKKGWLSFLDSYTALGIEDTAKGDYGKSGTNNSKGDLADSECSLEIRCDTILNNMDRLKAGKEEFVPENGCIIPETVYKFKDGETVFDILKKACDSEDIPIEYSWVPLYGSYYIEGINNLYEFDCGKESGWTYKVNGDSPNYGCSSYELKGGETIVWNYTCQGLGSDVEDREK